MVGYRGAIEPHQRASGILPLMYESSQKFFAAPRLTDDQQRCFVLRCHVDLGAQRLQCTADPNERLRSRPHHFYPVMVAGLPEMLKGSIDGAQHVLQ